MSEFSQIVGKLIDAFGGSQEKTAIALETTQPTVSRWSTGQQKPDYNSFLRVLQVAANRGISVDSVLGFEGTEATPPQKLTATPDLPDLQIVPIITWVSAGKLVEPTTEIPSGDLPTVAVAGLGVGEFFGLKVSGTSMDRFSPNGSVVIVNRREQTPQEGKPFIFVVKGKATYKLWGKTPARLEPHSTDPSNKTEFLNPKQRVDVVGRVRRSILDL